MRDHTNHRIDRHAALALASLALTPSAWAAFAEDGAARARPLALKSSFLDLVQAGLRLVAVGERGHVALSNDSGKSWRQAKNMPTRATLTCVHATDGRRLWAAGHGGVILQSTDGGESWALVTGMAAGADVLLSIRVEADGRGLAVGGFGIARRTRDGGKTWQPGTLLPGEAGEKHLNRIVVTQASTWLIAAEVGHVLRSADRGDTWSSVKTAYAGSLWNGVQLPFGPVLACGMRGNLVRSVDDGRSWSHIAVPGAGSLTGATVLADGRPAFVGVDGTVVVGDARGEVFKLKRVDDRTTFTAVAFVPGAGQGTLMAVSAAGMRALEVSA